MRSRLYLALFLAAIPAGSVYAASPDSDAPAEPAGIYAAFDANFAEATKSVQQLQECIKLTRFMSADLAAKEAALKAEFGGHVPFQLNTVLDNKHRRRDKQQNLCIAAGALSGALFEKASNSLRSIDPGTLPDIMPRQKRLNAARTAYNRLIAAPGSPKKETE